MFHNSIAAAAGVDSIGIETLESTLSLGEFYQKLRAGEVRLDSLNGGRAFGLALIKESFAL